jgi:hypothetical protein
MSRIHANVPADDAMGDLDELMDEIRDKRQTAMNQSGLSPAGAVRHWRELAGMYRKAAELAEAVATAEESNS